MAYDIFKSDGTPVSVAENTIDNDFYNPTGGSTSKGMGIQLIGRNAIDYGAAIAQTLLQSTENFASATGTQPIGEKALQGQLWYDKTISTLYVRVTPGSSGANDLATNWRKLAIVNPVNPTDGDIKVSGSGSTFKIEVWGNNGWHQIYPVDFGLQPSLFASNTTGQASGGHDTSTILNFNNVISNNSPASWTGNNTYNCQRAGRYFLSCTATVAAAEFKSVWSIRVLKNGSQWASGGFFSNATPVAPATSIFAASHSASFRLAANDTLQFQLYQYGGPATTIGGGILAAGTVVSVDWLGT